LNYGLFFTRKTNTMTPSTALAYCQDKCSTPGSALHYATIFLPTTDRQFWLGLFTLHQELRGACLKQLDEGLTRVKLGWWNNALRGTLEGGNPHPVQEALGPAFLEGFGADFWANTIEQVAISCEPTRHNTLAHWEEALARELGPWLAVVARQYGLDNTQTQSLLGFWTQSSKLAQVLALAKHLDAHFQPLPLDYLERHGVTAQALSSRQHSAHTTALLTELHAHILAAAQQAWRKCCPRTRRVGKPLRTLFRIKAYEAQLHQGQWLLLSQQHRVSPVRKFGLAWLCYGLGR
jgi:phytoene/squalene synthetase